MTIYKNATINGVVTDFGVENGVFSFFGKTQQTGIDLQEKEVIPGLVDIHTHGCVGRDVMDGNQYLEEMSRFYLKNGITAFAPTTMSVMKEDILRVTNALPETSGAAAVGYHLEGPFINPAFKGAQLEEAIVSARLEDLAEYHNLALITLAPEREGALDAIKELKVPVFLGHTAADYDMSVAALQAGAVGLTHTFNAMPPLHHRNPGPIGAALTQNAYVQVICDGLHLHPSVVLLLYKAFGPQRMVLISDSMRATGLSDGEYDLGGQTVTVKNREARLSDGTLAGSTATLLFCVKKAMEFGIPKDHALQMASQTPAQVLGLKKGQLTVGYDADFVVMDQQFQPIAAAVQGKYQTL